jgi:hypothetical protein
MRSTHLQIVLELELKEVGPQLFDHLKPEIIVAGTFDELLQIAFGRTGEGPIGSLL